MDSIRQFGDSGGFIFAECGGFMYLTDMIEESQTVGLLSGRSKMTKRLQRFGYIDLHLSHSCFLGPAGTKLTAHEFHRSETEIDSTYPTVFQIKKTGQERYWTCGYHFNNTVAGYPHFSYLGNLEMFEHMLATVERCRKHEVNKNRA